MSRLIFLLGSCFWLTGVSCLSADEPIDFATEVIPVLTKLGCNSGACHGSAAGRGDFHLSLYGSRPAADFDAIVNDFRGRRVNLVDATRSLLLLKPGGEVDHEGGYLFDLNDPPGQVLSGWLQQLPSRQVTSPQLSSAKKKNRKLVRLETDVMPLVFSRPGVQQQLNFVAHFSDRTQRQVTQWVVVTTPDSAAVDVDPETNLLTVKRSGRHILMARFLDQVVPLEIIIPYTHSVQERADDGGSDNIVDHLVTRRLRQLQIPEAPPADDATFLRRLTLDLTGRLPTISQVSSFSNSSDPDKRTKEIRRLLKLDSFTDYWAFRLSQQLRIRTQPRDRIGAETYFQWLKEQVRTDSGWDQMAEKMLTASGDSHLIGEANFYRTGQGAREQTEFVSEVLMGVTLRCANCHDHPLDQWTQDDYHGLAAVFAKVRSDRYVEPNPLGTNTHPLTGQPATPQLPGGTLIRPDVDGRRAFADWLVHEDNPYFASAMVNRLWKSLMGRGLVEPVDDLRLSNPATHPDLLQRLSDDFVDHGYRLRHTLEVICMSRAYQRARVADATAAQMEFYGSRLPSALSAEVLTDAVCDVTGVAESYPGYPDGTRSIQLWDSRTPSEVLDVLGRCSRAASCEADGNAEGGNLSATLHLMNGRFLNGKLEDSAGRLMTLLKNETDTQSIIQEFYLRSFSRPPTDDELQFWVPYIEDNGDSTSRRKRLQDFVWSLLNSREFQFNH